MLAKCVCYISTIIRKAVYRVDNFPCLLRNDAVLGHKRVLSSNAAGCRTLQKNIADANAAACNQRLHKAKPKEKPVFLNTFRTVHYLVLLFDGLALMMYYSVQNDRDHVDNNCPARFRCHCCCSSSLQPICTTVNYVLQIPDHCTHPSYIDTVKKHRIIHHRPRLTIRHGP